MPYYLTLVFFSSSSHTHTPQFLTANFKIPNPNKIALPSPLQHPTATTIVVHESGSHHRSAIIVYQSGSHHRSTHQSLSTKEGLSFEDVGHSY
ncbi:hypothetical protein ES332_A13G280200v1 [Gossypium tomentosum]|uniref:Uncharacterized protein n=1 Tax=Gossypium tomentosum TaxID=34277 RepID=A0A5D2MTI9_GOSTO|nr:hypothetical protein ES332_A13G280200v1 [Gossypium tomentosum]